MYSKNDLLLRAAARLYSLGIEVDAAREKLRMLADDGIPYDSPEMEKAYEHFYNLNEMWKQLEREYISLRDNKSTEL